MPARGARTTYGAFQTAAILPSSNAGPPFTALAMHFARRTPTRGRPTGRAPEAVIPPTRRSAIGAAIREISGHRRASTSATAKRGVSDHKQKKAPDVPGLADAQRNEESPGRAGAQEWRKTVQRNSRPPDNIPRHKSSKARIA